MADSNHSATPIRGLFNTLAQNGTANFDKPELIINGNGSELSNNKALKGRAKRKLVTQSMILNLVDVSDKYGSHERKKSYWNTYHCQNKVYTANGRLYGKYCKNRFCTLCCSIRKANILNRYLPVIQSWEEPYFVTLTVKAVSHHKLKPVMKSMIKEFKAITDTYRKRHQRSKGVKLIGIRSLESNFNPTRKTYNPHIHAIAANAEMANILVKEWLKRSRKGWTFLKAQKKSKIYNNELALIEVVKYGSKIFTDPDINKKVKMKGKEKIYVSALNNIFCAMKGLRIFERFGFNLPNEGKRQSQTAIVQQYDEWVFDPKCFDWLNTANGKSLTEYKPVVELLNLLENNIDTELQ